MTAPDSGPTGHSDVQCSVPVPREGKLPLVVLPRGSGPLDSLIVALRACSDRYLERMGSILFRGFGVCDERALRQFVSVFADPTRSYRWDGRHARAGGEVAPDAASLRNERACGRESPSRLWLCCTRRGRGEALAAIADCREVYRRIPPAIRRQWIARGLRFIRTYGAGAGKPWSEAFESEDWSYVEAHCRRLGIGWEWGKGEQLRLSKLCSPVAVHPRSGERVWFNDAHRCPAGAGEGGRGAASKAIEPAWQVRHADDGRIDPSELRQVRAAFEAAKLVFAWEPGDVLMLDNVLTAHAPNLGAGDVELTVVAEYASELGAGEPDPLRF